MCIFKPNLANDIHAPTEGQIFYLKFWVIIND